VWKKLRKKKRRREGRRRARERERGSEGKYKKGKSSQQLLFD